MQICSQITITPLQTSLSKWESQIQWARLHIMSVRCGILKMVGPKVQDFCPRINMLKGFFQSLKAWKVARFLIEMFCQTCADRISKQIQILVDFYTTSHINFHCQFSRQRKLKILFQDDPISNTTRKSQDCNWKTGQDVYSYGQNLQIPWAFQAPYRLGKTVCY